MKGEGILGSDELSRVDEQNSSSHHHIQCVLIDSRGGSQVKETHVGFYSKGADSLLLSTCWMAYILWGVSETDLHLGFTQAQFSSFTDEKTETKRKERQSKNWGLNTVCWLHGLCLLYLTGFDTREAEKMSSSSGLTWGSCSQPSHLPLPAVTLSSKLGQLLCLQDLTWPLAAEEASDDAWQAAGSLVVLGYQCWSPLPSRWDKA